MTDKIGKTGKLLRYVNMYRQITDYTHHVPTKTKTRRYRDLRRKIRRPTANVTGKSEIDTRRSGESVGSAKEKHLQLGSGYQCAAFGDFSYFSGNLWGECPCSYARKIIFHYLEYTLLQFSIFWNKMFPVIGIAGNNWFLTPLCSASRPAVFYHTKLTGGRAFFTYQPLT